jgi:hypothetical protein
MNANTNGISTSQPADHSRMVTLLVEWFSFRHWFSEMKYVFMTAAVQIAMVVVRCCCSSSIKWERIILIRFGRPPGSTPVALSSQNGFRSPECLSLILAKTSMLIASRHLPSNSHITESTPISSTTQRNVTSPARRAKEQGLRAHEPFWLSLIAMLVPDEAP